MTITLPDGMRAEVEAKAKAAGYRDVEEYIASLVMFDDPAGPDNWEPAVRQRLLAAAEEGLRSPLIADPEAFQAELERVAAGGEFEGRLP